MARISLAVLTAPVAAMAILAAAPASAQSAPDPIERLFGARCRLDGESGHITDPLVPSVRGADQRWRPAASRRAAFHSGR